MVITYRRTCGMFALVTLAVVALATTVLAAAVAAALLIVAVTIGAGRRLARAVLRTTSWHHPIPVTPWPQETIEATAVTPTGSSDEGDAHRMDSDKG